MKKTFFRIAILSVFFATACKETPPSDCYKPFEKSVRVERKGSHISIPLNELDFLFQPNFILDDVDLIVTLKGKHKDKEEEIELSLNGIKTSRRDGKRHCDREDYDEREDHSRSHFKLHRFFLNGAEPFHHYLLRLKARKGKLVIKLHTLRNIEHKIKSVELVFKGRTYDKNSCTKPSPTPTPTATPIDLSLFAPRIDSTDPSNSPTNVTTMSIAFSAQSSGGSFYCSLDNAVESLCSSPMNYANVSNGSHTFRVLGRAPNGQDAGSASYSWDVDALPPTVQIDNVATLRTLTNENSIQFFVSSSEPGTFMCSFDGATASACTSPVSYNGLSEGAHNFQVSVTDALGNASAPAAFSWSIDMTAPVVTISSVDPDVAMSSADFRNFNFVANEVASFECAVDSGAFAACNSPYALSNISEGNHWFEVRAIDVAGNVGASSSYSWVVDQTPPNLMVDSVYPAVGITNAENMSVSFSSSEPVRFFCAFDNGIEEECTSPYVHAMSEGAHNFQVVAEDLAGNRSAAASMDWMVDLTAPVISFGEFLPSSSAYINSRDFSVSVSASEAMAFAVSVNGVQFSSGNVISLSNLDEGSYVVSVVGVDSAGNASNMISHSFIVDVTAPILTISSSGTSPTSSDFRDFTFSASEDVSYECQLDSAGFGPCVSPLQYSGLADGEHVFTLRGIDLAQNTSELSYSWIVDTTPIHTQILSTNPSSPLTNLTSMLITFGADQAATGYMCSLNGAPEVACDTGSMSYVSLADGSHSFNVKAIDEFGVMDTAGASYSWTVDTIVPVPSNIGSTATVTTIIVTWATSEEATQMMFWGVGGVTGINQQTSESTSYTTSHSMTLSGLAPNTLYSFQVSGHDRAGNQYISGPFSVRTRR